MKLASIGVEEWLNVHERSASWDLAQSTISSMTTEELFNLGNGADELLHKLAGYKQNYGWIEGSPEFKEEVASLYEHVSPDQILQTNGATGANLLALYSMIEPGDEVVAEYPCYQPLYEIPRSLGARVKHWHLHKEDGFMPSIDELKSLVTPDTKVICINNASNPTGTILHRDFLEELVEIARGVDAYIISDEVYLPLENQQEYVSILDIYEKGIVTNSLSKTYSVPGLRIGWIAANLELTEYFRTYRDYTLICGGVISDELAVHVLKNRDQIFERNYSLMTTNRTIVDEWIEAEPRVSWLRPKGVSTSYISFDIPMDDEKFCLELLQDTGVLLVPGSRFDLPSGARLGYCAQEETLRRGLKELSGYLKKRFDS